MLVIDAAALVGWLMPDEAGIDLAALAAAHDGIAAPWLLWAELRNILIVSERHGRIPADSAEQIADTVDALGIPPDTAPADAVVFDLARRHRLTVHERCIWNWRCGMARRWPAWTRRCWPRRGPRGALAG